jgi:hypothetical protein
VIGAVDNLAPCGAFTKKLIDYNNSFKKFTMKKELYYLVVIIFAAMLIFTLAGNNCCFADSADVEYYQKIADLNVNVETAVETRIELHKNAIENFFMSSYPYFHGAFLPNEIKNSHGEVVAELHLGIIGRIYLFITGIIQVVVTLALVLITFILLIAVGIVEILLGAFLLIIPFILLFIGLYTLFIGQLHKRQENNNHDSSPPLSGIRAVAAAIAVAGIELGLGIWFVDGCLIAGLAPFDFILTVAELLMIANWTLGNFFAQFAFLPGLSLVVILFIILGTISRLFVN